MGYSETSRTPGTSKTLLIHRLWVRFPPLSKQPNSPETIEKTPPTGGCQSGQRDQSSAALPQPVPSFFEGRCVRDERTGCLLFAGGLRPEGYGRVRFEGRTQGAHRVAWQLAHGPIPEGFCVCHRCDEPQCIEATHLFLGTVADNNADMAAKGRQARGAAMSMAVSGERSGGAKVTEADVRRIRAEYATGKVGMKALGKRFGLSRVAVSHIINGRTWKYVDMSEEDRQVSREAWRRAVAPFLVGALVLTAACQGTCATPQECAMACGRNGVRTYSTKEGCVCDTPCAVRPQVQP